MILSAVCSGLYCAYLQSSACDVSILVAIARSNLLVFQVYALGGFMVLKWMWARWRERNTGGRSEDSSA